MHPPARLGCGTVGQTQRLSGSNLDKMRDWSPGVPTGLFFSFEIYCTHYQIPIVKAFEVIFVVAQIVNFDRKYRILEEGEKPNRPNSMGEHLGSQKKNFHLKSSMFFKKLKLIYI